MVRTDDHRPSAINPEEYDYVCPMNVEGDDFELNMEFRERINDHMISTGGKWSKHEHGGICHICGCWNVKYKVVFYHKNSNTYIITGTDCADKMGISYNSYEMNMFKTAILDNDHLKAGKKKAIGILEDNQISTAWRIYNNDYEGIIKNVENARYEVNTVKDMVYNVVKYGNISEKQISYIKILIDKILKGDETAEKRRLEKDSALPVPTGKGIMVVGVVLSIKNHDTPYGTVLKMTVKNKNGWLVWGSVPSNGPNFTKGDTIKFTANVEASPNDNKFGFFKLPRKLEVVEKDINN